MAEGLLVGSIYAKLGAIFDPRGFKEQELAADKAKATAAKPIHAKLGAVHDPKGFGLMETGIGKVRSGVRGLDEESKKLSARLEHMGGASSGLAKQLGGAAAAFGLFEIVKQGTARLGELEKTSATTNAVIKATGDVSKVSAKQVDELAAALQRKTGIDHEVTVQAENMLLGFTKVRNEVGKGNDIFNKATVAAQNLQTRFGSIPAAAKALGIALDNPATGLTRLSRAGIKFTEDQKLMIAKWLEHGEILKAQQYILATVEGKYHGVADAIGKTTPAALERAKVGFKDIAATIMGAAAPAIKSIGNGLSELSEQIKHNTGFGHLLRAAWDGIKTGVGAVVGVVEKATKLFKENTPTGEAFRKVVVGIGGAFVALKVVEGATSALGAFLALLSASPLALAAGAIVAIGLALDASGIKFKNIGQFLEELWAKIQTQVSEVASAVGKFVTQHKRDIDSMGNSVRSLAESFLKVVTGVGKFVISSGALQAIGGVLLKIGAVALQVTADFVKLATSKEALLLLGAAVGFVTAQMIRMFAAMLLAKIGALISGIGTAIGVFKALWAVLATNPFVALFTVIGLVAGALLGFGGATKRAKITQEEYTSALRAQGDAMKVLKGLEDEMATKRQRSKGAALAVKEAEKHLKEDRDNGHAGRVELERDELNIAEAKTAQHEADKVLASAGKDQKQKVEEQKEALENQRKVRTKHIEDLKDEVAKLIESNSHNLKSTKVHEKLTEKLDQLQKAEKENKTASGEAAKAIEKFGQKAEGASKAASTATDTYISALNAALKSLGADGNIQFNTKAEATKNAPYPGTGGMPVHARGGWLGQRGEAGPDDQLILAAKGEGVVNRHQVPYVENAMSIANEVTGGAFPYANLDELFGGVTTKHYAGGGIIGRWAGGGINREQAMEREATRMTNLRSTYVYGGGHGSTPAPANGPWDCSSSVSRVVQAGGYKLPTDTTPNLLTDWHLPSGPGPVTIFAKGEPGAHTFMRFPGNRFFGTTGSFGSGKFSGPQWWGSTPPASYLSQFQMVHLPGISGAAGESIGGGNVPKLAHMRITGPDGMLKRFAQAASDRVGGAAQKYLEAHAPGEPGGGAAGGGGNKNTAGGQYDRKMLEALWVKEGGNPSAQHMAAAIALAESSGNPNSENHNTDGSIDRGLWQINSVHGAQSTFNIPANTKAAISISSNGRDWSPWATYKNGAYRQFMAAGGFVKALSKVVRAAAGFKNKARAASAKPKTVGDHSHSRKVGSYKNSGHHKAIHVGKLPPGASKRDEDHVQNLNTLDAEIKKDELAYGDKVFQYNKENTLAGGVIDQATFDAQQQDLRKEREQIGNLLGQENTDVGIVQKDFEHEAGPKSHTYLAYKGAVKAAKTDKAEIDKLTKTLEKAKAKSKSAAAASRRAKAEARIHSLEGENGKVTGATPPRIGPYGEKLKGSPGKKVDKSKQIASAKEGLAAFNEKEADKGNVEAIEARLKEYKKKFSGREKVAKEEKKKLDQWKKLAEQIGAKKESLPGEIDQNKHESAELATAENVGDEADLGALTPDQQAEQDKIEYELSVAASAGGGEAATAAAELPIEQKLLTFAQGVLAYRKGKVGAAPTPAGYVALKSAQDQVNSISAAVEALRGAAPGGVNNPDTLAKLAQSELRTTNLEALNRAGQQELSAFSSSGDIGQGSAGGAFAAARSGGGQYGSGPSVGAYGAPGGPSAPGGPGGTFGQQVAAAAAAGAPIIFQHVETMHPSDPHTLAAVADSTVNALNGQSFARNSREPVL